jgi:hypothetical protein
MTIRRDTYWFSTVLLGGPLFRPVTSVRNFPSRLSALEYPL